MGLPAAGSRSRPEHRGPRRACEDPELPAKGCHEVEARQGVRQPRPDGPSSSKTGSDICTCALFNMSDNLPCSPLNTRPRKGASKRHNSNYAAPQHSNYITSKRQPQMATQSLHRNRINPTANAQPQRLISMPPVVAPRRDRRIFREEFPENDIAVVSNPRNSSARAAISDIQTSRPHRPSARARACH